jgi:uncharacterized damage-inducible protein DinB
MTYYGTNELAASFRLVRSNTIRIAEDIPEDRYGFKATPDTRSVSQVLVHIAFGPAIQSHIQGNRIDDLGKVSFPDLILKRNAEESRPRSKAEILTLLRDEGETFASYLESLSESFLAERVAMPAGAQPATKSRFEMLLGPKEHEMHHRAQLMLLQRMIGLVPHLTRQMQERHAQAAARLTQP